MSLSFSDLSVFRHSNFDAIFAYLTCGNYDFRYDIQKGYASNLSNCQFHSTLPYCCSLFLCVSQAPPAPLRAHRHGERDQHVRHRAERRKLPRRAHDTTHCCTHDSLLTSMLFLLLRSKWVSTRPSRRSSTACRATRSRECCHFNQVNSLVYPDAIMLTTPSPLRFAGRT